MTGSQRMVMARTALGMTKKQLAAASGISQTTIMSLERGKSMNIWPIRAIAKAMKIPAICIVQTDSHPWEIEADNVIDSLFVKWLNGVSRG